MYTLTKKTVDSFSVQDVFKSYPTKEQLYSCIFQFFDHQESLDAEKELENNRYASMNDYSCTEFEIHMPPINFR